MAGKIYVGDVGTAFKLVMIDPETNQAVDLSTATSLNISVRKQNGQIVNWAAQKGANIGEVEHIAVDGDLDIAGRYEMQAVVALPAWSGRSETVDVIVYAPFR